MVTPVFWIHICDTPLAQRASYLALHSSLFGPDGVVNYDNIATNTIINSAHTLTIVVPIWPMLQNVSKLWLTSTLLRKVSKSPGSLQANKHVRSSWVSDFSRDQNLVIWRKVWQRWRVLC